MLLGWEHTIEILQEFGLSQPQISTILDTGVAIQEPQGGGSHSAQRP
jgi:hypothetical protein